MTQVLYLTNRNLDPSHPMPYPEYGATVTGDLRWGLADVPAFTGGDEDSVDPSAAKLTEVSVGAPGQAVTDALNATPGNHFLIFFHGFDFTFREAVVHSAWLAEWYAGAATQPVKGPILCCSFPSLGSLLADDASSLEKIFDGPYDTDYQSATDSAPVFAAGLPHLQALATAFRARGAGANVSILAHSMGNHVLASVLGLAPPPPAAVFDRIISIAGDEAQASVADNLPDRAPNLRRAAQWAKAAYVYYNDADLALLYSSDLHGNDRLGRDGPPDPGDRFDLPTNFRVVNATYSAPPPPAKGTVYDPDWEHHQYYRLYPWVRDDLALVMNGVGGSGSYSNPADLQGDVAPFPHRRIGTSNPQLLYLYAPGNLSILLRRPPSPGV